MKQFLPFKREKLKKECSVDLVLLKRSKRGPIISQNTSGNKCFFIRLKLNGRQVNNFHCLNHAPGAIKAKNDALIFTF